MNQPDTHWKPALYNDKHAFVYQYGESLIDILAPQAGELVLDLGCGSGQLTAKIAERGAPVIGIDNSADMIHDAQAKYPALDFHVMDAADFRFDQPFDAIFSNAVLHWVLQKEEAIQCMYQNLKPGGRLILEFGGKGNVGTIVNQLRQSLQKRGFTEQASIELWYFPSIGEYATLLEKKGFRVTLSQHYERPTELADEQTGIQDWIEMFGGAFLKGIPATEKNEITREVQTMIREQCFSNGKWYADYKRIRIVAIKA